MQQPTTGEFEPQDKTETVDESKNCPIETKGRPCGGAETTNNILGLEAEVM